MRVRFLGTGTSFGVPVVGCECEVCGSDDARDRRTRHGLLLEEEGKTVLVDTPPELRLQLLRAGIRTLDGVYLTHPHADHCHGIDDLRPLVYRRQGPIDAYADTGTMAALTQRFGYAFTSTRPPGSFYKAMLNDHTIPVGQTFDLMGLPVTAFEQGHGQITTLGYRIGPLGYSPDASEIGERGFRILAGVELWIVDCLRYDPHPSHAHFERTMDWIARVAPIRAVLTHMNHTLDYNELAGRCPAGVEPGHDGLTIELDADVASGQPAAE